MSKQRWEKVQNEIDESIGCFWSGEIESQLWELYKIFRRFKDKFSRIMDAYEEITDYIMTDEASGNDINMLISCNPRRFLTLVRRILNPNLYGNNTVKIFKDFLRNRKPRKTEIPVTFKIENTKHGKYPIAIFHEFPASDGCAVFYSYCNGRGEITYLHCARLKAATFEEYADLLDYLNGIFGNNIVVKSRMTYKGDFLVPYDAIPYDIIKQ